MSSDKISRVSCGILIQFFCELRRVFTVFVVMGMVTLSNCTFIELRLYPPVPNQIYSEQGKSVSMIWVDETLLGDNLAYHRPYLFPSRSLQNRYGSLVPLLQREMIGNPARYPLVHSGGIQEIRIKEFKLESKDGCWKNTVSVSMRVELKGRSGVREVIHRDEIVSHVTDCFLVGSSITLVPLLWYTPYVGFRGNREDQLNQLGRNAILILLDAVQRDE